MDQKSGKRAKFFLLIILVVAAIFSVSYFDLSSVLSPSKVKESILSYGPLAPIAFTVVYIIATIIFLPGTPLTIAGGAVFGTVGGTVYTVIGATIGALIAFLIARYLGGSFVEDTIKHKYKTLNKYNKKIEQNGLLVVLFLRIVPLFPFNGLNFALGLTKVRTRDYLIGTAIGIIPGSFVLAFFGGSLASLNIVNILVAILLFILLSLAPSMYKKVKARKNGRKV